MVKNAKKVMIVIAVMLVSVLALAGCVKSIDPLTGDSADAVTVNNDSMVVSHGEYIYFVNGTTTYDSIKTAKDNKYGNVTKSAIYRAKADGTGNAEVVVPQIAMSNNKSHGLSVLGNYLYFASPATTTDKNGNLQTSHTDFYRVEINGQNLDKIVTVPANSMDYKFTDTGLFYIHESKLHYVDYSSKKDNVVAEKYGSAVIGSLTEYDPNGANIGESVAYTKAPEETDGKNYNILYVVDGAGVSHEIMNGSANNGEITYSVKNILAEGDELVVYYEKTDNAGGESKNLGLFAVKVDKEYKLLADSEKRMVKESGKTVRYIDYNTGVYVIDGSYMFIPVYDSNDILDETKTVKYELKSKITADTILDIRNIEGKKYIYYLADNALNRVEMDTADKGKLGTAEVLVEKNVKTDGLMPVLLGDVFYYVNTSYFNYVYRVDLSADKPMHKIIGVRTEADLEAYVNMVEDMDDDEYKKHTDLIIEDQNINRENADK